MRREEHGVPTHHEAFFSKQQQGEHQAEILGGFKAVNRDLENAHFQAKNK